MRHVVSRPLVAVLLAALVPCANASEIHVPADYSTIQAAINAATAGDTVVVASGTFYENVDFIGKGIVVRSSDGPSTTTIDGGGLDAVVVFVSGESASAMLDGFTIRDGSGRQQVGWGAPIEGGGIFLQDNGLGPSSPVISNCVIVANHADNGGGIFCSGCSPILLNNVIRDNSAGGYAGGVFFNNAASDGSLPIVTNNTISRNTSGSDPAGMWCTNVAPIVTNSILWGDLTGGTPTEIRTSNGVVVEYSDVQGGFSGTGNINADPLFVDAANGDTHLGAGSPCIDAGSGTASDLPGTDLDGDARILGAGPDIGADEAHPILDSISPTRSRYDRPPHATLKGSLFTSGFGLSVTFGATSASNVAVVDDQTITCDVPAGEPGRVDVVVSNSLGAGILLNGFSYTPSIVLEGDFSPGGSVTAHIYCDPLDGLFVAYGLPPSPSIPTPPFHGNLSIVPFSFLAYLSSWPFNELTLSGTIPNDPGLSGADVLLQALVGPRLTTRPKDGAWTNCAVLSIR